MRHNRMKEFRLQRNLSQEYIAFNAGISQSHVSKLENNQLHPTLPVLRKIAQALEVELLELVYDTDEELEKAMRRWRSKRK
jgi:transcriptional regulator with XRE-family HTH domain